MEQGELPPQDEVGETQPRRSTREGRSSERYLSSEYILVANEWEPETLEEVKTRYKKQWWACQPTLESLMRQVAGGGDTKAGGIIPQWQEVRRSLPGFVIIYALVCTRPDIAHAVGVVSRYLSNPGREHWEAMKWILRYLKCTSGLCLKYGDGEPVLEGFTDADMAGHPDEMKSTLGMLFTFTGGAKHGSPSCKTMIEMKQLRITRDYGLLDKQDVPVPMVIWWLVSQYVIFGFADVFTMVGLQEFCYHQVPTELKCIGLALYLSFFGVGSFLGNFLISTIEKTTSSDGQYS
ncbi:hypothetical protein AgCh_012713 [Apium graveolens]